MRKLLTSAAVAVAVLAFGAAHAAPTCHQKVALSGQEFFTPAYKLGEKVTKMVKPQALDMMAATDGDREEKAKAYVEAVATTTAKLLKATLTDDFNEMTSQVTDKLVNDYETSDKYTKDTVSRNNNKAVYLGNAKQTVITGFFACKN